LYGRAWRCYVGLDARLPSDFPPVLQSGWEPVHSHKWDSHAASNLELGGKDGVDGQEVHC
jgi:hypothetical protein